MNKIIPDSQNPSYCSISSASLDGRPLGVQRDNEGGTDLDLDQFSEILDEHS